MNEKFLNEAFSNSEKKLIQTTNVDNSQAEGYSENNTSGGSDTQDKVFLLSYKEAFEEYFSSAGSRICKVTAYAERQMAFTSDAGNCRWWLRSPGSYQFYAAVVYGDGSRYSDFVNYDIYCIRPALWINLGSDIF